MKKKKNPEAMDKALKRQFMRMKSPSAFGAGRRFDSPAFMNVPPEMGRRDAAYSQITRLFQAVSFDMPREQRRILYERIIALLTMVVEKTEFISGAGAAEKRQFKTGEVLDFLRLVLKYFNTLDNMAASQSDSARKIPVMKNMFSARPDEAFVALNHVFHDSERDLLEAVKTVLQAIHPLLISLRERRRKSFSKSDSERYEKAYAAFFRYYADNV